MDRTFLVGVALADLSMIIVYLRGGLGNQLFQYAAGRALALRLNVPLRLDISCYEVHRERAYELDRFNIQATLLPVEKPAQGLWTRKPFSSFLKRFKKLRRHLRYEVFADNAIDFEPRLLSTTRRHIFLDGYWQSERYFEPFAAILRRELTLRDAPDPANAALLGQIGSVEAVSLHVRRGDYITGRYGNPDLFLGLDYYQRAMARLSALVPNPHYFIFSDDPAWTRDHLRLDAPATYVTHNLDSRDHEDLRLMAACRHHIIANSTFSWWGAWLAENPGGHVFAPRRWFPHREVVMSDRLPAAWIPI